VTQLGQQTGAPESEHNEEARRILVDMGLTTHTDDMSPKERNFVEDMFAKVEEGKWALSGKQLFYLRDLKDKYCT
jgi:hypothetical protein